MKKILHLFAIIVIFVYLIFACSPKKTIQQSQTAQKTIAQNNIINTDNIEKKATVSKTEIVDAGIEIVTKITDYDTSKPTDKISGKPPIIRETVKTTKKEEKKNTEIKSDSSGNQLSTHIDKSKINNDNKSDIINKEIPKTPAIAYWFWIVGIVIVLVGIFFVRKYWVRIKTLFS